MLYRLLNWSLFKLLYPDILSSYQNKKGKLQIWSLTFTLNVNLVPNILNVSV